MSNIEVTQACPKSQVPLEGTLGTLGIKSLLPTFFLNGGHNSK